METCKTCEHYKEQLDYNNEPTGNTYCIHPKNKSKYEGNTNKKDCPLEPDANKYHYGYLDNRGRWIKTKEPNKRK